MHFNNYQQAIDVLSKRVAEPPFEDIRTLVHYQKRSRKFVPIPFWFLASATLTGLAILLFPEVFGLQWTSVNTNVMSIVSPRVQDAVPSQSYISTKGHRRFIEVKRAHTQAQLSVESNIKNIKANLQLPPNKDQESVINTNRVVIVDPPKPASENPQPTVGNQNFDIETPSNHRYAFFFSAGFLPNSGQNVLDLLSGSIGAAIHLNNSSSLILELRRNAFIQKTTTNVAHYHDTTLTIGGNTYRNSIGEFTLFQTESPNNFLSLNVGYRFQFLETNLLSAFAEGLTGVSTHGVIVSELIGIQYSIQSPWALELALRNDQLFSSGSLPQGAINGCISVMFTW